MKQISDRQKQDKRLVDLPERLHDYQHPEAVPPRSKKVSNAEKRQALVEQRIQAAMANGEFDNLPGAGKPLPLNENPYLEPGQAWAFDLLKRNGFAPEWIERGKAIRRELEQARRRLCAAWEMRQGNPAREPHWQAAVGRFEETLHKLNRKIDVFNLIVPALSAQRERLQLARELQRVKTLTRKE
jgi:DnaJ family protein C protein 28